VAHDAGYYGTPNALRFSDILTKKANEFSKEANIRPENVFFLVVRNSNHVENNLFFYAVVPKDWKPTENTAVFNENTNKQYPDLSYAFFAWLVSFSNSINTTIYPPNNPHILYKSK